jgi:hypothetical protein
MKYLFFATIALGFTYISHNVLTQNSRIIRSNPNYNGNVISNKMKIEIGTETFTATLYDNETTVAFKKLLPLTLSMSELNNNEKYAQLPTALPTNTTDVGTIHEGDIMLWGANTLVVFYKTFKTTYSYTKLGHIDNPRGLASAVGSKSVIISFGIE